MCIDMYREGGGTDMTATKGPWRTGLEKVAPTLEMLTIRTQDGEIIAYVSFEDFSNCRDNGNVLAASPTMLEALKKIAELVEFIPHYNRTSAENLILEESQRVIRLAEEGR